uniref:RING-type E3 ubiquitin transferase n=1 Tax=Trichuris muris TaxID=70415 RepID=A0A5S6QHY2_TRIMR
MAGPSETVATTYNNTHRYVARAMLSKQLATEEELLCIVQEACTHYSPGSRSVCLSDALAIVNEVNNRIDQHGYSIVKRLDEQKGVEMFVLICKSLTEEQKKFEEKIREAETKLLYNILDAIMQSDHRRVTVDYLQKAEGSSRLRTANSVVQQWFKQEWFIYCEDRSFITLGVRALAELERYLVAEYRLNTCTLCNFIVFTNLHKCCPVCQNMFHNRCFQSYVETVGKLPGSSCPFSECTAPLSQCTE